MQDIRLTLIQDHLAWEDRQVNLDHFSKVIEKLEHTDIIVLPEMFNSGFTVKPDRVAEPINGPTVTWMKAQAAHTGAAIAGSLIIQDGGAFFNRLVWVNPNGSLIMYDKRHLFRMGGEHERFNMGNRRVVIHYKGWKILPLICYDLRFPVWSQNRMIQNTHEYDLLIYVANWPASRSHPWKSLLIARSIENQCFVAGLNRVGRDGQGIDYSGDSRIITPKGELLMQGKSNQPDILSATLLGQDLVSFRENFQVGLDWDIFYLPGTNLGMD